MDSDFQIFFWDIINILDSDSFTCQGKFKNGKECGRKCTVKYKIDSVYNYSCKTHSPKGSDSPKIQPFKKKTVDNYKLQEIATTILKKLEQIDLSELTEIYIELQPKCNPKILLVSHIIYTKFVDIFKDTIPIKFVRASQKLKAYTGPFIECKLKGKYAQRKWLSIQYTRWFLENKFTEEQKEKWLPFFESHTKKDDISDSLLMVINGISGIPKKQLLHRNGKEISI